MRAFNFFFSIDKNVQNKYSCRFGYYSLSLAVFINWYTRIPAQNSLVVTLDRYCQNIRSLFILYCLASVFPYHGVWSESISKIHLCNNRKSKLDLKNLRNSTNFMILQSEQSPTSYIIRDVWYVWEFYSIIHFLHSLCGYEWVSDQAE